MRSLTSFQTNQNHPYFTNAPTNKGVSPLVSQYMDMFDASKVDMSLLQKRERPSVDDILQHELQKKVKTLMGNPVNAMPNLAAMLYGQQNLPLIQNIPVKPEVKTNFAEQLKMNSIRNLQQALNFKQQHDALHLLQSQIQKTPLTFKNPQTILTANTQDVYVKEEYTREESPSSKKSHTVISLPKPKMCDTMSENNTTNDSLSVASPDKGDFIMPSPLRDEPVLTEYTKAFPEWDLATIFSFLKSGKSMDAFEKEKKFRMERKLKKQRNSMKKEAKQSKKAIVM